MPRPKPSKRTEIATTNIAPINRAYGELCEDLHFTGYAFERGCHRLRELLSDDSWKQCAGGFTNVDDFLSSLQLDQFAKVTEERREIAKLIKALRPEVSTRAIGRALKVKESTLRGIRAPEAEKAKRNNRRLRGSRAPSLSGTDAAKVVALREGSTRVLLGQSNQNDWRTPRKYLEAAREVMGGIDLDPATSIEANETVKATTIYTESDNGLVQPWKGRVWLNPPYGGEARIFVDRLLKEYQIGNVTQACLLTNSHGTETKWFQALFDYPICFVAGRMDFGGPSRDVSSSNTHGSCIIYLGEHRDKFAKTFSKFGAVVARYSPHDA